MLSLPNELIALVLGHLSDSGPMIIESSWPLQSSSNAWLPLVQSCHRVRDVAISTQHLWRRITVFSKTGGLNIAFSRSGDLEIDVILHEPHIIPSAFMMMAPHAARVRTLVVVEADRHTHSALRFLLARPMPALTTCQIHVASKNIPPYLPLTDTGMRFVARPDFVPNLRTLQLGILGLDWTSEILPGLHRLSLRDSFPRDFLTFDSMLDVLESCTALEHLELRYSQPFVPPAPSTHWHVQRSVALPHLRTLILESHDYAEASALLSHLRLSEHVDVDIKLDIDTDIADEAVLTLPDILPLHPAQLPLLASATSAFFGFLSCVLLDFTAPARGPGRLHAFLDPASEMETDQGWLYTPSRAAAHFCALLAHAPLRALKLQLAWPYAGEPCAASGMFAHMFQAFPALEELEYGGGANEASNRQLLEVLANGALPRLRMLRLGEWSGELVSLLVEVLQMRIMAGLPLSQLDIQIVVGGESVPGTALQELQGLVDGDVNLSLR